MRAAGELKFSDVFYAPVNEELANCESRRDCISVTDAKFLLSGIGRCLEPAVSGREWVQKFRYLHSMALTVSNFFDAIKSKRRLRLLKEIAELLCARTDRMAPTQADPFFEQRELDGFAVYAADGHYHCASAHETLIQEKRYPVGHFYAMNLRTQSVRHLDVTRPLEQNKKTEHDMHLLKRMDAEALRMGEPRGRKVLLAYDPAIIDFTQWYNWKQSKGIYIVTRQKDNMNPTCCGFLDFNRDDPRNNGVVRDEQVGVSGGILIRRITYIDPVSGKKYVFITNEMTLPPGLLAFVYKKRWDIEKVYDEFKNHLMETKAWADSPQAKCQQANFICMTHNLLLLLEHKLEEEEEIRETKIEKKRQKRRQEEDAKIKEANRKPNPLAQRCYRCVKRTLQFLRQLRLILMFPTSWRHAVSSLRPVMEKYLT
jgi:hypothetical protein